MADTELVVGPRAKPVEIGGVVGDRAGKLNGVYNPTRQRKSRSVVYIKATNSDVYLSRAGPAERNNVLRGTWLVQSKKDFQEKTGDFLMRGYGGPNAGSPIEVDPDHWEAYSSGKYESQASVFSDHQ